MRGRGRTRTNSPVRLGESVEGTSRPERADWEVALEAALATQAARQDNARIAAASTHHRDIQALIDRIDTQDAVHDSRNDQAMVQMAQLTNLMTQMQAQLQVLANSAATTVHSFQQGGIPLTQAAPNAPAATGTPAAPIAPEGAAGIAPSGGGGAGIAGATRAAAGATSTSAATSNPISGMSAGVSLLGKDIKIPVLPMLGKPPNGLPYVKWSKAVLIRLRAVGAGQVLNLNWTPSTPEEQQWWEMVNPLVFAALYESTQRYETLSDNVARHTDDMGCGRLAWNVIKAYHVRLAEGNRETLLLKLNALVPGDRESMESFLCRCNNLREEFQQYNLSLEDSLLISHVFSHMDQTWRWMSGFADLPTSVLTWDDVQDALQKQDNQRRQGNKQNALTLPLGWIPRDLYNKPKEAAAHAAHGNGLRYSTGNESKGQNSGTWAKNSNDKPQHSGVQQNSQQKESFFICYCCLEFGHGSDKCPKRTPGWKVTAEVRAKALQMRNLKLEKHGRANVAQGEHAPNPL